MAILQKYPPASLRTTPNRPANPGNLTEASRPYLVYGRKGRTAAVGRSAFVALPHEPEDVRITGGTRSLDRRLLALNLRGVRVSVETIRMA